MSDLITPITQLETALKAEINSMTDALGKAEASVLCDRYIAALTAQSSMESGAIQSYSIAGRTVTRRDPAAGEELTRSLRSELNAYIGGNLVVYMGGTPC